uniref:Uncharacterized protein n=1 Tax=Moniliophthora roreri TaxID=221103 RepID=A0A0W0FXU8_MONRR
MEEWIIGVMKSLMSAMFDSTLLQFKALAFIALVLAFANTVQASTRTAIPARLMGSRLDTAAASPTYDNIAKVRDTAW